MSNHPVVRVAVTAAGVIRASLRGMRHRLWADPPTSSWPAPPPLVPHRDAAVVTREVNLTVSDTPNPHALKFVADVTIVEKGSLVMNSAADATGHPFAEALFELDGVRTIFAVRNFVTITKRDDVPWSGLQPQITDTLTTALGSMG